MNNEVFVHRLLEWYPLNKRDLPWRNTHNPYIIWLSEIILQQTRVAQGLPYFENFLKNYPNVNELANAPSEEVMRLWQGLGYYSRARNLHQCAKDIVEKYNGDFPNNYKDLLKLKGVGSYTAAAIASFAFEEKVAVVDGNVFRVLSRYFGIATDIAGGAGKKEFENLANKIIPHDNPGEYNQAIMEFGALQCVPKNPDCENCPLKSGCFAHNNQMVENLPVKIKKLKIKDRHFQYYYIICGNDLIIKKRGEGDIWQGLYDFPMEESDKKFPSDPDNFQWIKDLKGFVTSIVNDSENTYKHILTHQRIFANFVKINLNDGFRQELKNWADRKGFQLVSEDNFENLAKPKLISRFLNDEK
ncbi:A/G-specific adenine glycosylase [Aquiflexum sp.]|uniref:A/G-specific adenine glycosylase n=1 Tax=Aquiflexum sp. TaxID=1872584 RepID=UPI00359323D8